MSSQFYQLTLQDAIAHYQNGDITAKGLLHFYLKIRLRPGWTLKETQKEICETLGISRAAFYSALSKLKAEGSISWSAPANTRFSISLAVCERGQESTNVDSESKNVDSESKNVDDSSTNVDDSSTNVDRKSPKPALRADSRASSDFFSNSFHIFFNSLSNSERESFHAFCKYEASRLPRGPVLLDSWIEAHYEELWRNFCERYKSGGGKSSASLIPEVEQAIAEAIAAGDLARSQTLLPQFVILPNGDGMPLDQWLEGQE